MITRALAVLAFGLSLAGCGGEAAANHGNDALPNGMTVKQQIEARQKSLKELGAAFKTINDELKADAPALDKIRPAVQTIKTYAAEIGNWFPADTGPESGIETEAKARIWQDNATFQAAAVKLGEEAGKLSDVATGEDIAAIKAQVDAAGGACKNCHDTFRNMKDK